MRGEILELVQAFPNKAWNAYELTKHKPSLGIVDAHVHLLALESAGHVVKMPTGHFFARGI